MTRPKPWRNVPPSTITIAGIPVRRKQVQWLADNTHDPTSTHLRRALLNETRLLGLQINEREQLLRAPKTAATSSPSCAPPCSPSTLVAKRSASDEVSLTARQGEDHPACARRSCLSSRSPSLSSGF